MRTRRPRKTLRACLLLILVAAGATLAWPMLRHDPLVAGRMAIEEGDFRNAVVHLERSIRRGQGSAAVYADLAHAYELLERHDQAARALAEAMALEPDALDLVRRYGEALVLAGESESPPARTAEAFARAQTAQPDPPRSALGRYLLGRALQARYRLSLEAFEDAFRRDHDGPQLAQHLDAVRFALRAPGDFGPVRAELVDYLSSRAGIDSGDPIVARIDALRRTQEAALEALGRTETHDATQGHATLARAVFLLELERRDEAVRLCRSLFAPDAADAADVADVAEVVRVRAQRLLATALAGDPHATDAQLREAAALWGAFLYGVDTMPGTPRERNLLRYAAHEARGQLFVRLEDPEGLDGVAAALRQHDRESAVGVYFRGMAAYFRGDDVRAELDLQASLTRRPDYLTHCVLGTILARRGGGVNAEQALQQFRAASRLDPGALEPLLAEVRLYLAMPEPNYTDAYERIRHALRGGVRVGKRSREVVALRDRIEVDLLKRERDESYDSPAAAEAALAGHRGALYPLYYLATHHERHGDAKRAVEYAESLHRLARGQMIGSLVYARALLRLGTEEGLRKAETILNQAQDLDWNDGRPLALAVQIARARHQGARAWALLNRVAQADPFDVDCRLEIAQACYDAGQFGGARYNVDYLLSILEEPPYAVRRLDLELKLKEKRIESAARDLAALAPREDLPAGDLDYLRARVSQAQGQTERALAHYDRALAKTPARGRLVAAAARLELELGDEPAALDRLTAFRASGARDAEVFALLGRMLLDHWRFDDAMPVFEELRGIDFGDRRGQIGFGFCALHTGRNLDAGLRALEFALHSIPDDPRFAAEKRRVTRAAAFGRLEQRNWEAALSLLTRLDQLGPETRVRARPLLAYFNGDHEVARDLVERWIGEGRKDRYLPFLRGLLDAETSRTAGVREDVCAIVPDVPAAPPWPAFVEGVAREAPGFGRRIVAAVARVALLEDDADTAEPILRTARRVYPADRGLALLHAHVSFRRGRVSEALADLRGLGAEASDAVHRDLGVMCALEGDGEAPHFLQRHAARHPGAAAPLLAWARFEAGGDHYLDLLRTLREPTRGPGDHLDQVVRAGLACLVDGAAFARTLLPGDESLVTPYLRRWIEEADTPERLHRLARLVRAAAIGRLPLFRSRAVAELEPLLAGDAGDPLLRYLLARFHLDAHRPEAAAALLAGIREPADRPLALLARARVEAATPGGAGDATATLQELVRIRPRAVEARIALSRLLCDAGQPAAAVETLRQREDTPQIGANPRRLLALGHALAAHGDPDGALGAYGRAFAQAPQDEEIAYHLARELLRSRRYAGVAAVVARYPRLLSARPTIRLLFGLALENLGHREAARRPLLGFPYSADAAAALGRIALAARDREEAIRRFRYAYQLDPAGYRGALLDIAEIQMSEYDFRAAFASVNGFLGWEPLDRRAREMQAQLMEHLFKPDRALFGWLQAWLVDRSNPRPLLKGAVLLRKKGEFELARSLVRQLLANPPPSDRELREELERECYYLGLGS